ncbi:unnamed protein product [Natator depressus]
MTKKNKSGDLGEEKLCKSVEGKNKNLDVEGEREPAEGSDVVQTAEALRFQSKSGPILHNRIRESPWSKELTVSCATIEPEPALLCSGTWPWSLLAPPQSIGFKSMGEMMQTHPCKQKLSFWCRMTFFFTVWRQSGQDQQGTYNNFKVRCSCLGCFKSHQGAMSCTS